MEVSSLGEGSVAKLNHSSKLPERAVTAWLRDWPKVFVAHERDCVNSRVQTTCFNFKTSEIL